MNLSIKKVHPDALLPSYAHPHDAGMDLHAIHSMTLEAGFRTQIPTGIAMHIPEGYVGLIWDKSGRAIKEGLTVLAGVVDSGYRGEIEVVLLNTSKVTIHIEQGQKIAQMLIQPVVQPTIEEVEELDNSSRGSGGFGSTGL